MQRDTSDAEVVGQAVDGDGGTGSGVRGIDVVRPAVVPSSADGHGNRAAVDDTVLREPRQPALPSGDRDDLGDTVIVARAHLPGGDEHAEPAHPVAPSRSSAAVRPALPGGAGSGTPQDAPSAWGSPDDTVLRDRHDDPVAAGRAARPVGGRLADQPVRASRPDGRGTGLQTVMPDADAAAATRERVPSVRVDGRILRLDRPVVVGRRPTAPRVSTGPGPELVTVPSPSGQVSSSHVALHAEGEAVVVEDLRSTNGTVVRPAGAVAARLPAGASIVVLTGTLVEIGDGNVIEVLSPHLRVGSSDRLPPVPSDRLPPVPSAPVTG